MKTLCPTQRWVRREYGCRMCVPGKKGILRAGPAGPSATLLLALKDSQAQGTTCLSQPVPLVMVWISVPRDLHVKGLVFSGGTTGWCGTLERCGLAGGSSITGDTPLKEMLRFWSSALLCPPRGTGTAACSTSSRIYLKRNFQGCEPKPNLFSLWVSQSSPVFHVIMENWLLRLIATSPLQNQQGFI